MASVTIRPPTFSSAPAPSNFTAPTVAWLSETWHVTHSTLPMWKSKRNVRIQYTALPASDVATSGASNDGDSDRIDDVVTSQPANGTKISTIRGIDTAANKGSRGEWNWRGKGLLKLITSHWEVLGYGEEEGSGNKWVVTVFAKTLFTPAGVDVYSRDRTGVTPATLGKIKEALANVPDESVKKLAGELFEVTIDDARQD